MMPAVGFVISLQDVCFDFSEDFSIIRGDIETETLMLVIHVINDNRRLV